MLIVYLRSVIASFGSERRGTQVSFGAPRDGEGEKTCPMVLLMGPASESIGASRVRMLERTWLGRPPGALRCRHRPPVWLKPTSRRIDRAQRSPRAPSHSTFTSNIKYDSNNRDMSLEQVSANKAFDGQLIKYKFKVRHSRADS